MKTLRKFINKRQVDFLQIGAHDLDDIYKNGQYANTSLAVELDALSCLRFFPFVENLILLPGELHQEDLFYISELPIHTLTLDYYSDCIDEYTIDLCLFPNLEYLFSRSQYNFSNVSECRNLCTLRVQEWMEDDLESLYGSCIQALGLTSGKLRTISGLPNHLLSLQLANQRRLTDLSGIANSKRLESLSIEDCHKALLSTLPSLPSLQYLELFGRQRLNNLSILDGFPNLSYFLLDMLISDGNLGRLTKLCHCVLFTDHRHYSLRDCDLPKAESRFHSEQIPAWLEILPQA